jgi:hypothetical protein
LISFTYNPISGGAAVPLILLDSDRFWPARIDWEGDGTLQLSLPCRASSQTVFGRAQALVPIRFLATRQHATLSACLLYIARDVAAALGQIGTLTFDLPGGGRIRSVGCGLKAAPAYNTNVRSYINFTFVGPKPTAG